MWVLFNLARNVSRFLELGGSIRQILETLTKWWMPEVRGYSCSVRGCRGPYKGDPFDFVAAYLIPKDLWYIIPAQKIRGQGSIALYPNLKKAKYGPYKEAWHLLRRKPSEIIIGSIQGCAEEFAPGHYG